MKHSHIELSRASLCCNCESITDSPSACSCCGSHSLISLAQILNKSREDCAIEEVLRGIEAGLK
jgi:hypothetical protein